MLALVPTGEYAIGTWKHFRTTLKHLQDFMLLKYKISDLNFPLSAKYRCSITHPTPAHRPANYRQIQKTIRNP